MRLALASIALMAAALTLTGAATATPAPPQGLQTALAQGGYTRYASFTHNGAPVYAYASRDHEMARFAVRMESQALALLGAAVYRTDIAARQDLASVVKTRDHRKVLIVRVQTWNRYVVVTVRKVAA